MDRIYSETGLVPQLNQAMSSEIFSHLHKKSPFVHVDKVKAPVILFLGESDRRVPWQQAVNYYHALQARNIPSK